MILKAAHKKPTGAKKQHAQQKKRHTPHHKKTAVHTTAVKTYATNEAGDDYVPHQKKTQMASTATRPIHPLANRTSNPTWKIVNDMVYKGEGQELKQFLANPENRLRIPFDSQDWFGSTMLCTAVKKHFYKVVMQLLPYCDVNATSSTGPPLFHAIAVLDLAITRTLIENGADVNYADPETGQTALMIAASLTNPAYLLYLIDNGANLDAQDVKGRTATMYATKRGSDNIIACLRDRGADLKIVDNDGNDALFHGQGREDLPFDVIKATLEAPPITKKKSQFKELKPIPRVVKEKLPEHLSVANIDSSDWLARLTQGDALRTATLAAFQRHARRHQAVMDPSSPEFVQFYELGLKNVIKQLELTGPHMEKDPLSPRNGNHIKFLIRQGFLKAFTATKEQTDPTFDHAGRAPEAVAFAKDAAHGSYNNLFPLVGGKVVLGF